MKNYSWTVGEGLGVGGSGETLTGGGGGGGLSTEEEGFGDGAWFAFLFRSVEFVLPFGLSFALPGGGSAF